MKKLHLVAFFLIVATVFSCKKKEIDTSDSSKLDNCDPKRKTILANNWIGTLGYDNEMRKWTVNTQIQGTYDGMRTALICVDISNRFKRLNNLVIFSGELKESNGTPTPKLGGKKYITLTLLN